MQQENAPKVSVCVITYNQKKYIRQCLQSIVDQETDFDFEVIVGDDCSTDGTREIVQEFAGKYPKRVKTILHKMHVGGCENYRSVHGIAAGQYIAHVDGDDYAYAGKLLKQVNYLDLNENCALVAHRMSVWVSGRQVSSTRKNPTNINLTELLLAHPMFLHSSIMWRQREIANYCPSDSDFIDFYTYIKAAMKGDLGFINEVLGGYARNVGVSSKRDLMPYIQSAIDLAIGFVPSEVLNIARAKQYLSYAVAALMAGDGPEFMKHIASARALNKKSFIVFFFFKLRHHIYLLRFIVCSYKTSNLLVFRLNRLFAAGRNG